MRDVMRFVQTGKLASFALCAALSAACTTGEGKGDVESERLFVEECWNGPLDLKPDFFAAVPFDDESLFIRVQRGDDNEGVSDGLLVLVNDLQNIRNNEIGQAIPVGLPPGVSPPGVPLKYNPDPARVSMTLYLHDSCDPHTADLYAVEGTITFQSLFSGDLNEHDASDRRTQATFEANFADPRKAEADGSYAAEVKSTVWGNFSFFFQRGQPAQPFL
jgi:hypothetical protein